MKIDHLPNLNREFKKIFSPIYTEKFPVVLEYNEGMEFPTYKITIEKLEVDTYVDANGQKWKKVK